MGAVLTFLLCSRWGRLADGMHSPGGALEVKAATTHLSHW